jgi:hypothetical protein
MSATLTGWWMMTMRARRGRCGIWVAEAAARATHEAVKDD